MANIVDLAKIICEVPATLQFMRNNGLLKRRYFCCNADCSIVGNQYLSDGEIFQCNICKKRTSIRVDSFYSGSKLPLSTHLSILYVFAQGLSLVECTRFLEGRCSQKTLIDWLNFYRDVCTTYLANNPVTFSRNCTIHVDETFIGGKRKYRRGCQLDDPRWLFGLVCRYHHKIHMEFLEDQSHPSIIPIISAHVQRGATIHSDGANVYKCLGNMGYVHRFVVHQHHYVNPGTGIHSNHIENVWSNLKTHLKRIRGSQGEMLDSHIDEYIYRYNRRNEGKMFYLLVADIARYYPV